MSGLSQECGVWFGCRLPSVMAVLQMAKERQPGKQKARKSASAKQVPLERYISMLEAIASASEANLTDLAELCRLPSSSAHRVLHTLLRAGLVIQTGGKRSQFALGPRLMRLLHAGHDDAWLHISGQRVIEDLAQAFNETCFINKLAGSTVVTIGWAAPRNDAWGYLVPGVTQPLHATASAKAILAYQPPDFVRKLLPARLPKLCAGTKTSLKALLLEFAQVRMCGFATCWNEFEEGIAAVACPVFLPNDTVIYSIGTTGLADRLSRRPVTYYATALQDAAARLADAIHPQPRKNGPGREQARPASALVPQGVATA